MRSLLRGKDSDPTRGLLAQIPTAFSQSQAWAAWGGSWQWSWLEGSNPSSHISQVSIGYEEMTLADESLGGIRQLNQFAEHVMTGWTEEHPSVSQGLWHAD